MKKDPYRNISKVYDPVFQKMNAGLFAIGMKMHPVGEGATVLDIGCGTGIQLARYQRAGCQVTGIDPSPSMLQVAQEKLGDAADLRAGDAADMPFADESFDLITASLVLHEMSPPTRKAVVEESKRTLKKDGRLLLIDFHPGRLRPVQGWFNKLFITMTEIAAGKEHYRNYRDFMARQGLPSLASAHDLTVEQQKVVAGGNMAILLLSL